MNYEAPAKLNLALLVDPPDASGLHPVDSIVQTVEWLDFLYLEEGESEDSVDVADLEIDDDENLVLRASRAVRDHADFPRFTIAWKRTFLQGPGLVAGAATRLRRSWPTSRTGTLRGKLPMRSHRPSGRMCVSS